VGRTPVAEESDLDRADAGECRAERGEGGSMMDWRFRLAVAILIFFFAVGSVVGFAIVWKSVPLLIVATTTPASTWSDETIVVVAFAIAVTVVGCAFAFSWAIVTVSITKRKSASEDEVNWMPEPK
jgi:hypothetical protein